MSYLLQNYENEQKLEMKPIRDGFGDGILQAGRENESVVLLSADLPGSLRVGKFQKEFPDRYFEVGVAEQNMAGIATGMEHVGKTPFIATFASFSPGVNFSQIRLAALGHQNIKIVGSHYGLNTGKDGSSAQMNADVAMMKALPGMVIINPADYNQAVQATVAMANTKDITYLRVNRPKFPVIIDPNSKFEIGKAQVLMEGTDVTVIATGSMVYETVYAVEQLKKQGLSLELINIHTVKPLDEEAILTSAKKTGKVVVVEEHNIMGGLGESVARVLGERHPTPLKLIGVQDTFAESGSHEDLWKKYGLDRASISKKITEFMK